MFSRKKASQYYLSTVVLVVALRLGMLTLRLSFSHQILAVGPNPGVQYEYMVPINTSVIRYSWRTSRSSCTEPCAGGYEQVTASCVGSDSSVATDDKCPTSDRPLTGRFQCNAQPCPARLDQSSDLLLIFIVSMSMLLYNASIVHRYG